MRTRLRETNTRSQSIFQNENMWCWYHITSQSVFIRVDFAKHRTKRNMFFSFGNWFSYSKLDIAMAIIIHRRFCANTPLSIWKWRKWKKAFSRSVRSTNIMNLLQLYSLLFFTLTDFGFFLLLLQFSPRKKNCAVAWLGFRFVVTILLHTAVGNGKHE